MPKNAWCSVQQPCTPYARIAAAGTRLPKPILLSLAHAVHNMYCNRKSYLLLPQPAYGFVRELILRFVWRVGSSSPCLREETVSGVRAFEIADTLLANCLARVPLHVLRT